MYPLNAGVVHVRAVCVHMIAIEELLHVPNSMMVLYMYILVHVSVDMIDRGAVCKALRPRTLTGRTDDWWLTPIMT